jgi:hypothetical protein
MPFVNGNFDAGDYGKSIIMEAELLGQATRMKELATPIVAGSAILMNQNPEITEILEGAGMRCIKAKIVVMRSGNGFRGNKTLTCDPPGGILGGTEALEPIKELLLNPYDFTIMDNSCGNASDYASKFAYMSLAAKANIEVELSKFLVGIAGANADTQDAAWYETPGTALTDTYSVTNANFKTELLADIVAASTLNDMTAPIILNGRNFFNKKVLAEFESAGCCTTNSMLNSDMYHQYYWDLLNVDQKLGGAYTLAIDMNSMYFWNSPLYLNREPIQRHGDTYTWSEPLPRLKYVANGTVKDIFIDVTAKKVCAIENGLPTWGMHYQYTLMGAAGTNLPNANGKRGILKYRKTA